MKDLVVGLDIGTSSIKLVVLNINNNEIYLEFRESTEKARIICNPSFDEQNVDMILELVNNTLVQIPDSCYDRLKGVQVCGQMHGIVLWNTVTKKHSNLITWQDSRCTPEFLQNLPVKSVSDLNSGYGCATLFWLSENHSEDFFDAYNRSGTIHDYVTYLLSQKDHFMSEHNALSWGYFDQMIAQWQLELKPVEKFPFNLLPDVHKPGYKVSDSINLLEKKLSDTSIHVALGDCQCSFHACVENETDCVINMSTSAQLCMSITKSKYENIKHKLPKSISVIPYVGEKVILLAASLNGGNVLDKFVEMLIEWNSELGFTHQYGENSKDHIWSRLTNLSMKYLETETTLKCIPKLFAERHDTNTFASIENMFAGNMNLGEVFASICHGLVKNLIEMFPFDLLTNELGCTRVIATGSVVLKNPIIKAKLQYEFKNLPVVFKESNDSAIGAAMFLKEFTSF